MITTWKSRFPSVGCAEVPSLQQRQKPKLFLKRGWDGSVKPPLALSPHISLNHMVVSQNWGTTKTKTTNHSCLERNLMAKIGPQFWETPYISCIKPLSRDVVLENMEKQKGILESLYMVPSSVSPPPPSPPPWVGSPGSSPNSLLFASYWQHFWGPASYLLGLCSISDYQPRIY